MKVEYSANNSGGHWWVEDDGWKALEKAGWKVDWKDGRWLGALATSATKENCASMEKAVDEWERLTGCSSTDAGCPCCGQPHYFTCYDDAGNEVSSGPNTRHEVEW